MCVSTYTEVHYGAGDAVDTKLPSIVLIRVPYDMLDVVAFDPEDLNEADYKLSKTVSVVGIDNAHMHDEESRIETREPFKRYI